MQGKGKKRKGKQPDRKDSATHTPRPTASMNCFFLVSPPLPILPCAKWCAKGCVPRSAGRGGDGDGGGDGDLLLGTNVGVCDIVTHRPTGTHLFI